MPHNIKLKFTLLIALLALAGPVAANDWSHYSTDKFSVSMPGSVSQSEAKQQGFGAERIPTQSYKTASAEGFYNITVSEHRNRPPVNRLLNTTVKTVTKSGKLNSRRTVRLNGKNAEMLSFTLDSGMDATLVVLTDKNTVYQLTVVRPSGQYKSNENQFLKSFEVK